MDRELLLEIGMEEIPASWLPGLTTQLGTVLEAKLDRGRGPVATVLVQDGTLSVGDNFIAGPVVGRVRALIDDRGEPVNSAGPSVPVEILGFDSAPEAGDAEPAARGATASPRATASIPFTRTGIAPVENGGAMMTNAAMRTTARANDSSQSGLTAKVTAQPPTSSGMRPKAKSVKPTISLIIQLPATTSAMATAASFGTNERVTS